MTEVAELEIPRMAIEFMNDDHLTVIQLANDLLDLLDVSEPNVEQVSAGLSALLADCRAHFQREEVLMQEFAFPAYGCHKREHDQALVAMEAELEYWQQHADKTRTYAYMNNAFVTWFAHHVGGMDLMMSVFVVQQKTA